MSGQEVPFADLLAAAQDALDALQVAVEAQVAGLSDDELETLVPKFNRLYSPLDSASAHAANMRMYRRAGGLYTGGWRP